MTSSVMCAGPRLTTVTLIRPSGSTRTVWISRSLVVGIGVGVPAGPPVPPSPPPPPPKPENGEGVLKTNGSGVGSRTASVRTLESARPSTLAAGIQPREFEPRGKRIASHLLSKSRPTTSTWSPREIVPRVAKASPGPTRTSNADLARTLGLSSPAGSWRTGDENRHLYDTRRFVLGQGDQRRRAGQALRR